MNTNDDNLKTLLQRFVDDASAEAMAQDIRKGDALLDRCPSPVLDAEAAERIMARLKAASAAHRRHHRLFVGIAGAAAAALVMFVVLFSGSEPVPGVAPESRPVAMAPSSSAVHEMPAVAVILWDDAFRAGGDESFAAIRDELDNISASIDAVRVDVRLRTPDFPADRYHYRDDVDVRDTQLITTDFWKG